MTSPLTLRCRCGWRSEFDEGQLGLTIQCPECRRDFHITFDPGEFKNRNVGTGDFTFEDPDLSPADAQAGEESVEERTPRAPRRRGPSRHRAPVGLGKSGTKRKGGRWEAPDIQTAQSTVRASGKVGLVKRRSNAPVIIGILVVAGLGVWLFLSMASSSRERTIEAARAKARDVVENAVNRRFTAAGEGFDSAKKGRAFMAAMEKAIPRGVSARYEPGKESASGSVFTHPLSYSARFNVFVGERGYRCELHLENVNDRWQAHDFKVRSLTRAEWSGPGKGDSENNDSKDKS